MEVTFRRLSGTRDVELQTADGAVNEWLFLSIRIRSTDTNRFERKCQCSASSWPRHLHRGRPAMGSKLVSEMVLDGLNNLAAEREGQLSVDV